jgi:hypothetical protein
MGTADRTAVRMKLIANRQLRGEYGLVAPDQEFEARDEVAGDLLRRDLARRAGPPVVLYETKPIQPQEAPEVRPEVPFRDVPVPHAEPEAVASEGDSVLPESDPQPSRAGDSGGRRRRSRFDSK